MAHGADLSFIKFKHSKGKADSNSMKLSLFVRTSCRFAMRVESLPTCRKSSLNSSLLHIDLKAMSRLAVSVTKKLANVSEIGRAHV